MLPPQQPGCPQERHGVRGHVPRACGLSTPLSGTQASEVQRLLPNTRDTADFPHFLLTSAQAFRTPTVCMFDYFLILAREDMIKIDLRSAAGKGGKPTTQDRDKTPH